MRIAHGSRRTDLALHTMTLEQKEYLCEVERELDRLQRRSKAHRQNIRSMQAKLAGVNLRRELACLMQPQPLRAVL